MSLDEVSGSETEITESPESPSMYQISMAFDDFMRAFHEYKATNDRRLAELEAKSGSGDRPPARWRGEFGFVFQN